MAETGTIQDSYRRALAAWRAGDLAAARGHLKAALALDPKRELRSLQMLRADLLADAGQEDKAAAALAAVAAANPDYVWAPYRLAELAHRRGDLAAARGHLKAALALDPKRELRALQLLRADLLADAGQEDKAAAVLAALRRAHPDYVWAPYRLAQLAHRRGDLAAARRYLKAARALDPEGREWALQLLQADLLAEAGRAAAAETVLQAAAEAHPGRTDIRRRLARLARARGDEAAATAHLEAALARSGPGLGRQLAAVRLLVEEGAAGIALDRLRALRDRHGPDLDVLLLQAQAHRAAGQGAEAEACLADAIAAHPLDPRLLRHLYGACDMSAASGPLDAATGMLRGRIDDALADELELRMLLKTRQFHKALGVMRRAPRARRTMPEALNLATALFGAYRYETALRYLRLCLRRWPDSHALRTLHVDRALKLGRFAEVDAAIAAAEARGHPEHMLQSYRFMACGYRLDLDGAVTCYERLRDLGQLRQQHRVILTKMAFARLDPAAAKALFARIGNPMTETADPHLRLRLAGRLMMEIELEDQALAEAGDAETLADWVRARRGSTGAAIRLIDEWRAADPGPAGQGTAAAEAQPVPRRIFQYWDAAAVPEALRPVIDSWAGAPGYQHRLFDRVAAAKFLREAMGPVWANAFRLARNPAQEADYLRLCLLAREGGIWADADDFLYGDLGRVLGPGRGLILYREPLGGAVGNNFMAAPAGHPVIVYAARLARAALLQPAGESTWSRTGPGLVARVVGQYLARTDAEEARARVTILDWSRIAAEIAMHNPVRYKTTVQHWSRAPRAETPVWGQLQDALEARADAG